MLTNYQITDIARRMGIPLAGVYFKDDLPDRLEFNKTYIINLQDSENDDGEPNQGTHWTALQINKTKDKIEPIYFDSYGAPPPPHVKEAVKKVTKVNLPYTTKDIQSIVNNACGWYCLAFSYWINDKRFNKGGLYDAVEGFLGLFDDLNKSIDFKKNEYILKHFFRSKDPNLRKIVDVDSIVEDDTDRPDILRIPVGINMIPK